MPGAQASALTQSWGPTPACYEFINRMFLSPRSHTGMLGCLCDCNVSYVDVTFLGENIFNLKFIIEDFVKQRI